MGKAQLGKLTADRQRLFVVDWQHRRWQRDAHRQWTRILSRATVRVMGNRAEMK